MNMNNLMEMQELEQFIVANVHDFPSTPQGTHRMSYCLSIDLTIWSTNESEQSYASWRSPQCLWLPANSDRGHNDAFLPFIPTEEEQEIIERVLLVSWRILRNRSDCSMPIKSVELANGVRQCVTADGLKVVKRLYTGYLAFLESHADIFHVDRDPKKDTVGLLPQAHLNSNLSKRFQQLLCRVADAEKFINASASQLPTKCIHVGNVPSTFTEETFALEFCSLRPISTKLVITEGRRYGFINFATVRDAVYGKLQLMKWSKWKSNTSYSRNSRLEGDIHSMQYNESKLSIEVSLK